MADNTNRRAGVISASINGTIYDVAGDAKYSLSSVKRESLVGQSGVQGYSEMPVAGSISMTIRDSNATSSKFFELFTAATIVLNCANGKTVTGFDLWLTEAIEVNTMEGTFEVKFEGISVVEF